MSCYRFNDQLELEPCECRPHPAGWHFIHSFGEGFILENWDLGYRRELHPGDVHRLLGEEVAARLVEPLPPQAEIEEIYEQIRPTLGAEAEERMRRLRERPIRFDRIITPRFDCSPGQDIRSLLAASPSIKELLETGGPLR